LALGAIVEKQQGYLEFTYRSDQCYVQIWSDIKTNVTLDLIYMVYIVKLSAFRLQLVATCKHFLTNAFKTLDVHTTWKIISGVFHCLRHVPWVAES
jgi:hypothetical protein